MTSGRREPRSLKNNKDPKNHTQNGIGLVHRRAHQLDPETRIITIWEEGNPTCLVNLTPRKISDAIKNLTPEICNLPEYEHKKKYKINEQDELLRLAFWDEYFQACDEASKDGSAFKMRMDAIYPRICSREYFYKYVVDSPEKLAFIIKPPRGYMLSNRNLLEKGYERMREILELPITDENGKADAKLIGQILKAVILLENRVRGSVAHQVNINQQTLQMNVDYEPPKTNRNVDQELLQVEKEILSLTGKSFEHEVIDVFDAAAKTPNTEVISDRSEE